jgi:hypothetical protein
LNNDRKVNADDGGTIQSLVAAQCHVMSVGFLQWVMGRLLFDGATNDCSIIDFLFFFFFFVPPSLLS